MEKRLPFLAWARRTLTVVTVATIVAGAFPVSEATASCNTSYRVSHSDATCLIASWDNSALNVYTASVTSNCAVYGTVVAKVDLEGSGDRTASLTTSDTRNYDGWGNVDGIYCCWDLSDLCWEEQVKENALGRIKQITFDGTTWTTAWIAVGSHQDRFNFCNGNSDHIYCTVDPEGDANINPATMPGDCDGSPCTVQDCRDEFDDSPAGNACTGVSILYPAWSGSTSVAYTDRTDEGYRLVDNNCKVYGVDDCTDSDNNTADRLIHPVEVGGTDIDIDDMSDLRYCEYTAYDATRNNCSRKKGVVVGTCPEDASECTSSS